MVLSSLAMVSSIAHAQVREADYDAVGVITFAKDSVQIDRDERKRLEDIGRAHAKNRDSLLIIEGHASNLGISQRRTDAVRGALVKAGADPNRLVLVAYDVDPVDGRRVVVRSTSSFPDLAREQTDPVIGEDARAAGRTTATTAVPAPATSTPAPPAPSDRSATTVVIVPPGGAPPPPATPPPTGNWGPGVPDRTSGGAGDSALTGTGMEPTAEDSAPEPGERGPTIFGFPTE